MSYILDALRKADAERARGSVPSLHTRPVVGADAAEVVRRPPPWRWAAVAAVAAVVALAVLLGALGWWAGRESASMPVPVPGPVATGPAEAQSFPAPAPAAVAPQAPPLAHSPAASPLAEVAPARALITLPEAAPVPAPVSATVPRTARPASAAGASAAPPATSRVMSLAELPADLRRQLPALAMGGSVYSDRPASRFVMINGQLLREGDIAAPGLVVESLRPKSVVFVFRGQRFEWPY